MQRFVFALAVAALAVLAWSTPARADPPTRISADVQGVEQSTGMIVGNTRQGVTFGGTADGDPFTVTVDYTPANPCRGTNRITGGAFSLTTEDGVISGRVVAGRVSFDANCQFADVSAVLVVTGGTGAFADAHGAGRFTGRLEHQLVSVTPLRVIGLLTGAVELIAHGAHQ